MNYLMRTAMVLLVCGLFSLCTVTGTVSKYNTTVPVNSNSVRAGLFEVAVKKGDEWKSICQGQTGDTVTIDLFEVLYEDYDVGGEEENATSNDVTTAGTGATSIIAPGTGGKMKITVKNFSEVGVLISVASSAATPSPVPIEWKNSGGGWQTAFPGVSGSATLDPLGDEEEYEFEWSWEFETGTLASGAWWHTNDLRDTGLGQPGNITYEIPLTISATQID